MRRLLSIFMVVCLFNVSIQGAVADLHQVATSPLPHHSISVPVEPDHDLNTMTDRVLAKISATCSTLKDYITTAVHHPIGMTLTAMSAVIVGFYGLMCLGLLVGSLMTDQPFAVSHSLLWGGSPTSFGLLDTCQSPYVPTEHARAFADYEHLTHGSLQLTEVIPIWLNNAQHLLTLLGGIALQLRHGDHSNAVMERWAMFQENASTFLRAHGMPLRANNISCDLLLGDGTDQHPDQLLQCQYESPPEDFDDAEVSPGAHAKLWLVKWWRHFFGKDSVQLVTAPRPRELKYAQLDMSPDYMNVNHEVRTDSRRRLLQLGNVLSLPEAIKSWHENAEHWLDQAYAMADALRHRMCPEIDVPNGLNNLTQRIFDAHQAVMNNGTVRCDADLSNNRFEITACQFDKTPTEYNHELRCDNNAHVQFPGESAIWMIPNTENLYKTFLMVSRHVQPTPAPTPQPTQAPTLPATTDVPTTLEPTTADPTTHAPTDVPTTAAPTPQPTTMAPARNTTTRLYWSIPAVKEIWVAEFNQTDGSAINPRIFYSKGLLITQNADFPCPRSIQIDANNQKLYWLGWSGDGQSAFTTLYSAVILENSTSVLLSNKTAIKVFSGDEQVQGTIHIDLSNWLLFWTGMCVRSANHISLCVTHLSSGVSYTLVSDFQTRMIQLDKPTLYSLSGDGKLYANILNIHNNATTNSTNIFNINGDTKNAYIDFSNGLFFQLYSTQIIVRRINMKPPTVGDSKVIFDSKIYYPESKILEGIYIAKTE